MAPPLIKSVIFLLLAILVQHAQLYRLRNELIMVLFFPLVSFLIPSGSLHGFTNTCARTSVRWE